jgi:hypothetical protein
MVRPPSPRPRFASSTSRAPSRLGTTNPPTTRSRSTGRGITSFPPTSWRKLPRASAWSPWDNYPSAHPLKVHRPRDHQLPPSQLKQAPPRELRRPWDDYPSTHPLKVHRPWRWAPSPRPSCASSTSQARASVGTATSPRGPHGAKPHRLFLLSDRARYGPHPLSCEPPCPAGEAAARRPPAHPGRRPAATPAVQPPWSPHLFPRQIGRGRRRSPKVAGQTADPPARAPPAVVRPPSPGHASQDPPRERQAAAGRRTLPPTRSSSGHRGMTSLPLGPAPCRVRWMVTSAA